MSFHEVSFPDHIAWGATVGPTFSTSSLELESGRIETIPRWNSPRLKADVSTGLQSYEDLASLREFFIARRGPATGFRFKDHLDYHSNPTLSNYQSAPGTMDQLIGTGDGSQTVFQLKKTYTSGLISRARVIRKPVAETVRVWVNGVEKVEDTDFTVDTTTGLVTFVSAPANGYSVHASFEFDVPMQFAPGMDEGLMTEIRFFGGGEMPSINLIEVVDPDAANVDEFFYGGAYEVSSNANLLMSTGLGRLWNISMGGTGLHARLPDPDALPRGTDLFTVVNGGGNSFDLQDEGGAVLCTLASGDTVDVHLTEDSGGVAIWICT